MNEITHMTPPSELKALFESAAMEARLEDDGALCVTEGLEFPVWIECMAPNRAVVIYTDFVLKENADIEAAIEFANRLNGEVAMVQFCVRIDGEGTRRLTGRYVIPTEYGVESRHLISAARRFASAFIHGVRLDTEDAFTS